MPSCTQADATDHHDQVLFDPAWGHEWSKANDELVAELDAELDTNYMIHSLNKWWIIVAKLDN